MDVHAQAMKIESERETHNVDKEHIGGTGKGGNTAQPIKDFKQWAYNILCVTASCFFFAAPSSHPSLLPAPLFFPSLVAHPRSLARTFP